MTTPTRRRDATRTRQLLLEAARHRFASDGYAATTVRDIADDAGVNVALISRYFSSKEGLFEACLTSAVEDMRRTAGGARLDEVPERIVEQLAGIDTDGFPRHLVLLLRSSGDARADEIRVGMLRTFAERLAALAGWEDGDDELLLRAQVTIAASLGIALLRSNTKLEPLGSAGPGELIGPVTDLIGSVLGKHA
ncbi:helix-turn-helix transcriptional regulator [Actinoplanes sp. LDG1-06]|uniref:Helix-turn-helix transcriptional regulator n=1 Tax=Paractinoplanes ovalisporus TaxID=2810368 RepID=A0ABS2ASE4_9ACTN|nr:TetR family transcriptional regulator [Actinoplanes ovalisporus]MBM2622749.1 helix-turn-helix transcriptional regulator [Actinoplanes ovalisporus]